MMISMNMVLMMLNHDGDDDNDDNFDGDNGDDFDNDNDDDFDDDDGDEEERKATNRTQVLLRDTVR